MRLPGGVESAAAYRWAMRGRSALQPLAAAARRPLLFGRAQVPRRRPQLAPCQIRSVSIQPAPVPPEARSRDTRVPLQSRAVQLGDLAADMERALRSSSSSLPAGLGRWGELIGSIRARTLPLQRTGLLHLDGMDAQAVLAAGALAGPDAARREVRPLAASVAGADDDAFAGWLCSCDRVVLLAGRPGIVQALAREPAFRRALGFHPRLFLVVDGLEPGHSAATVLDGVLRESFALLGVPAVGLGQSPHPVVALEDFCSGTVAEPETATPVDDVHRLALLECALRAAIAAAEAGCATAFAPMASKRSGGASTVRPPPHLLELLRPAGSTGGPDSLPWPSQRLQRSFEDGDLGSVDASVGAIKHRVLRWFATRHIWTSALMRVCEVSDSLVEDAVLDRSFEEADLGMVHAAGRLNEAIRTTVSELAEEIDALGASAQPSQSALLPAKLALQALALQMEPVDPSELSRHVWAARRQLSQSDVLDGVPTYIRWSLAQFWAINGVALAGPAACVVALGAPLHYAAAGTVGLAVLAFVWLARRWSVLRTRICRHVDAQGAALQAELAAAHTAALRDKLDGAICSCVGDAEGLLCPALAGPRHIDAGAAPRPEVIAAWKTRLLSAAQ
ncbi:hypothetical protein H4R19_002792 [Coemansia spiralis]|nr:hypothetical protein H4R19_002792 [Coemansia spiralis]